MVRVRLVSLAVNAPDSAPISAYDLLAKRITEVMAPAVA